MTIVLLGPPGAGKGTQAARLARTCGMVQISTGEMLRDALRAGTPAGLAASRALEAGTLVSDAIVSVLLAERLDGIDVGGGLVLDGFPRTEPQVEILDRTLLPLGLAVRRAVELEVDDDTLVRRLGGRFNCVICNEGYHDRFRPPATPGVCDACHGVEFARRADDDERIVRTRLAEYRARTAPVVAAYRGRGLIETVDASAGMAEVERAVDAALGPA